MTFKKYLLNKYRFTKKKRKQKGGREEGRKGGKKGERKQTSAINNKRAFSFTQLQFSSFVLINKCNEINLSAKLSDFARNTVELKQGTHHFNQTFEKR